MLGQQLDAYSRLPSAIATIQDIVRMHSQPGNEVGLIKAWIESYVSWVVVMDNFDDISFDVNHFIPSSGPGQVMFTSRNKRLILGSGTPYPFKLDEPDFLEGEFLFLRLRNKTEISFSDVKQHNEYPQIREIVKNLHGFPLALSQAAAYIRANDPFSCAEYLELLTAREDEDREFLLKYMPENAEYPWSVMSTWELSFDYLQKKDPDSVKLLQLLGFFAPSEIPIYTFRKATQKAKWYLGTYAVHRSLGLQQCHELKFLAHQARLGDRLGLLISLSLISKDSSQITPPGSSLPRFQDTISMHPLVHEWVQLRLKPQPEQVAKFAHLCALILYQSYSIDRYVGFVESSPHVRRELETEPYRLQSHLLEVAGNVSKYEYCAGPSPLELRTLLLVMLLENLCEPGLAIADKVN
ncbi:hypothetical protein UA08_00961 [Talaromyces atroroseus]|uniref:NB-ARC domain-containing protein n=1 Tax=Talaromyces atroroseus TaxID=1441469 RepID=A0A225AZA8_TALAT|nr:hypothetical protein UA08_00961 [Talaromyces atroroseus]OKL63784.1 hypothetical protein UA08_00961 [Talaromyces atroroseus]